MLISTCQTLWAAFAVGAVAAFTLYSVDFSKVFSCILDFKFKPIKLDLVKITSIPATCALIGFLITGEAKIGNSQIKVTECKSKTDSKVTCSFCSISNTIALK